MRQSGILYNYREVHKRTVLFNEQYEHTGTSGIITPFCKTSGLFFDGAFEPESFKYDFDKEITDFRKSTSNNIIVDTHYDNISEYFEGRERFKEMNSRIKISEIERTDNSKYYIKIKLASNTDDI